MDVGVRSFLARVLIILALLAPGIGFSQVQLGNDATPGTLSNKNISFTTNLVYAGASGIGNSWIYNGGFAISGTASTGPGGFISPYTFYIGSDTVNTTTSGNSQLTDLLVLSAPSTGHTGGRIAVEGYTAEVGTPGTAQDTYGYVGVVGLNRVHANLGGTASTWGNTFGSVFGGTSNVYTDTSAATHLFWISAHEFDVDLTTDASIRYGWDMVGGVSGLQGTNDDAAMMITDQGAGFGTILQCGGYSVGPCGNSLSTFIGAEVATQGTSAGAQVKFKYGLDLNAVTGTSGGFFLRDEAAAFTVDWNGNAVGNSFSSNQYKLGAASLSAASWATAGIGLSGTGTTYTDTSASGTIANEAIYAFPSSTIAATNTGVTITNLSTLYLANPAAGTNVTAGGTYSLQTQGAIYIQGNILGGSGINVFSGASTLSGGTVSLNNNSNSNVNINTGTSTGTTTIGNSSNTGKLILAGVATDSGVTDASLCRRTSDGTVFFGSGTIGICLGTSSARYKHGMQALEIGLDAILALKPIRYYLNADHGDRNKPFFGFTAEDMQPVIPELVGMDTEGKPNTADYLGVVPVLVKATQELDAKIDDSRSSLEVKVDRQQIEIYALSLLLALSFGFTFYRTRR